MEHKNILVISRSAWRDDNNTGNTLSSFFDFINDKNIANIYCREELPQNKLCSKYLQLSEKRIFLKLLGKKVNVARQVGLVSKEKVKDIQSEKAFYDFFKKNRLTIFLWFRELIWATNLWRENELNKFIKDFKPDIIYSSMHDSIYMYNILLYVNKLTDKPIITFHGDDHIVCHGNSFSPFFWINKFLIKRKVLKVLEKSSLDFVITEEQKKIYDSKTKKNFLVLKKTKDFKEFIPKQSFNIKKLKFVFAGNIIYGRINTLINLAKVIERYNIENYTKHIVKIYTHNHIEKKHMLIINNLKSLQLCSPVSNEKVFGVLSENDILLHVEATDKKTRLVSALSFSTKIIDYLEVGRPIVAIGWSKSASINYLKSNQIGYCLEKEEEIKNFLIEVCDEELKKVALKSYNFGKLHHSRNDFFKDRIFNLQY